MGFIPILNKPVMRIVLFTHPSFMQSQSMPRYAKMLLDYFKSKEYKIDAWSPKPFFYKVGFSSFTRKWFGYVDQYLVFPIVVWFRLMKCEAGTLFVFADQALGPWVPLVANRKHVVHCHDFLALRSALGELPENPTSKTGNWYQAFIRAGFSKGRNFISVSKQTEKELRLYYKGTSLEKLAVIYNGLNQPYVCLNKNDARKKMEEYLSCSFPKGYILHVGGNDWYKNRIGVVEIYVTWRNRYGIDVPLVLLGNAPNDAIMKKIELSSYSSSIHVLKNPPSEMLNIAYSGSNVLLFPSLAEGFGWPIAEAMASGTLILTTNEAPMTEVGGEHSFYMDRMPFDLNAQQKWAHNSAAKLQQVLDLSVDETNVRIQQGIQQAQKFTTEKCLTAIEVFYKTL